MIGMKQKLLFSRVSVAYASEIGSDVGLVLTYVNHSQRL
jgi:hypothetical protein